MRILLIYYYCYFLVKNFNADLSLILLSSVAFNYTLWRMKLIENTCAQKQTGSLFNLPHENETGAQHRAPSDSVVASVTVQSKTHPRRRE